MGGEIKATRPDEADDLPCDNGTGKGNLALVKTREVREPGRASAVTGDDVPSRVRRRDEAPLCLG